MIVLSAGCPWPNTGTTKAANSRMSPNFRFPRIIILLSLPALFSTPPSRILPMSTDAISLQGALLRLHSSRAFAVIHFRAQPLNRVNRVRYVQEKAVIVRLEVCGRNHLSEQFFFPCCLDLSQRSVPIRRNLTL